MADKKVESPEKSIATIVESAPSKSDSSLEYGKLIQKMKKAKEKISTDIEIADMSELIIKNVSELMAVRAIRDKKLKEKRNSTQSLLNKFRSVL